MAPMLSLYLACSDGGPVRPDTAGAATADSLPNDTGHADTSDTLDTADLGRPYFDCGPPPDGAIVVELTSYYSVEQFFNNTAESGNDWAWYLSGEGANTFADECTSDAMRQDYYQGTPGAYDVTVSLTMPPAYPGDYLGEYTDPSASRGSRPGASVYIFYQEDGLTKISGTGSDEDDTSILCLSRVRPNRVSGTFTYLALESSYLPEDYFIKFDFQSSGTYGDPGWDDGTCMYPPDYYLYDDPDDVWDPAYWK